MSGSRDPAANKSRVLLDLNNSIFQENWFQMEKPERSRVTDTLKKIRRLTWSQVYQDQGLKWEKITSLNPTAAFGSVYSLRVTQSRRATAYRDGEYMRFLTVQPDHDSTYGKK